MLPTFDERQELAKQFKDDVARMRSCLHSSGRHVSEDDVVRAWAQYSDDVCAGWLMLPNDDPRLLEILLKYLTSVADTRTNSWQATIIDAGDGSGDGILELPDELLTQAGWKEGDQLAIDRTDSGELILRRAQ